MGDGGTYAQPTWVTPQMFTCLWQPNLLQVAKFLDAGMKKLHTVDPDEGSNI